MRQYVWRWVVLGCSIWLTACSHLTERGPAASDTLTELIAAPEFSWLDSFEPHRAQLLADGSFSLAIAGLPALRINRALAHWEFGALNTEQQLAWLLSAPI